MATDSTDLARAYLSLVCMLRVAGGAVGVHGCGRR